MITICLAKLTYLLMDYLFTKLKITIKMKFIKMFISFILLVNLLVKAAVIQATTEIPDVGWNHTISDQMATTYSIGVSMGIINPEKYSFESFKRDDPLFRNIYEAFVSSADTEPMTYKQWLVMNNYGLLADTQESIFLNQSSTRSSNKYKKRFKRTVETGDILITTRSDSGLIGHAAIMVTDYWVLEMEGGKKFKRGIKDNNRQISKDEWYDENESEAITVYRCPDAYAAHEAAYWADRNYFDPYGGSEKTIHVTYKIIPDSFDCRNPSYSSKLVLQAYYYGTSGVVRSLNQNGPVIAPTSIPAYFSPSYTLEKIGRF